MLNDGPWVSLEMQHLTWNWFDNTKRHRNCCGPW